MSSVILALHVSCDRIDHCGWVRRSCSGHHLAESGGRLSTTAVFSFMLSLLNDVAGLAFAVSPSLPVLATLAFVGMLNGTGTDCSAASALDQAIIPGLVSDKRRTWNLAWYNVLLDGGGASDNEFPSPKHGIGGRPLRMCVLKRVFVPTRSGSPLRILLGAPQGTYSRTVHDVTVYSETRSVAWTVPRFL
jgi:hypothetical protein